MNCQQVPPEAPDGFSFTLRSRASRKISTGFRKGFQQQEPGLPTEKPAVIIIIRYISKHQ